VHDLVAEAFIGDRPDGMAIAHRDGNSVNNLPANLRYCSYRENEADKAAHGTKAEADKNGQRKLSSAQVSDIRRAYKKGHSEYGVYALAKKYGVSRGTMRSLVKGRTWQSVRT